jgi:hypothetical protein
MGKKNQYNSPTVQRAITLEIETIKDILATVHPKGMTVRELALAFHKAEGYILQRHTVQTRLNLLHERDEVHAAVQTGKGGAVIHILGPAPEPVEPELPFEKDAFALPVTEEPPLSSDEIIEAMFEIERKLTHRQVRTEEQNQRVERDVRWLKDRHRTLEGQVSRMLVLMNALCENLDVKVD